MISDTLSDAVSDIEAYLSGYPEVYGSMEQEIRDLVEKMEVVRRKLDTPPTAQSGDD